MVGEFCPGKAGRKALRIKWQHCRVPLVPLCDQPVIDTAIPVLEVSALHRVLDHIEEEGVVEDLEIFPVAVARCLLIGVFVAPVQSARHRCSALGKPGLARCQRPQARSAANPCRSSPVPKCCPGEYALANGSPRECANRPPTA